MAAMQIDYSKLGSISDIIKYVETELCNELPEKINKVVLKYSGARDKRRDGYKSKIVFNNGQECMNVDVPDKVEDKMKLCFVMYCIGKRSGLFPEIHIIDDNVSFSTKHRCHDTDVKERLEQIDDFYKSIRDLENGNYVKDE